mmetsp:Transcript_1918/g.2942  ORF Transcript_1918/g.2942 Transcript_1918/m.2942 type:complete len:167 (-) Transcript_1918:87-587(-)
MFGFCCCQAPNEPPPVVAIEAPAYEEGDVHAPNGLPGKVAEYSPPEFNFAELPPPPPKDEPEKEFLVCVVKQDNQKIGMKVDYHNGKDLVVILVREGVIATWNEGHPSQKIEVGDTITSVNGKKGNSRELLDELALGEKLDLFVKKTAKMIPDDGLSYRYEPGSKA